MPTPFPVSLILLPGFSLFALGAVRSVFTAANEVNGEVLYKITQYAVEGPQVLAQCGIALTAVPLEQLNLQQNGFLMIIGDERVDESITGIVSKRLQSQFNQIYNDSGWIIGACGAGSQVLAECGFLEGYRAAIHWQILADAVKRYPSTIFTPSLFEIDRNRISAGAGAAVLDLLLHWLGLRHGSTFAAEVAAILGVDRLRSSDERQPVPASAQPALGSARLKEALELMAANLAEPLQAEDIAQLVGVSRRQLERLFRQHLDTFPSRYYLELRLKHARRQLKQTTQSILQVGLACGFTSGPHFSTTYRNFFGYTPREERARHTMPQIHTKNSEEDIQ
ncbi:GlxA family transcriptional regulator [Undibacterium fentianense]|uniref:Helix-turn-helix domain-containing protein n=1 Tax=Undibacterium fentianense TaxID=2828728 RepID=A0A941IEN5_9BURK|nr:helix-turn-helix domain-containing protein [Undibacterium fentianense]MBR7799577.1 helix-turn-helix domain-containing protein [Undibacterium fentianense]